MTDALRWSLDDLPDHPAAPAGTIAVRRFTAKGQALYEDWVRAGARNPAPWGLLSEAGYSERLRGAGAIDPTDLQDRYDLADRVCVALGGSNAVLRALDDYPLWNWLSLLFFDALKGKADAGASGPVAANDDTSLEDTANAEPNAGQALIDALFLQRSGGNRARHLIATACEMRAKFGEDARLMLSSEVIWRMTTLEDAVVKRRRTYGWLHNRKTIQLINMLYGKPSPDGRVGFHRGAASSARKGPGVRRLIEVLDSADRSHFLHACDIENLAGFLDPEEFLRPLAHLDRNLRDSIQAAQTRNSEDAAVPRGQRRRTYLERLEEMILSGKLHAGERLYLHLPDDGRAAVTLTADAKVVDDRGETHTPHVWVAQQLGWTVASIYKTLHVEEGLSLDQVRRNAAARPKPEAT